MMNIKFLYRLFIIIEYALLIFLPFIGMAQLERNETFIFQKGFNNKSFIDLYGLDLITHVEQFNSKNQSNIKLVGENIFVDVKQIGEGNLITGYVESNENLECSATLFQQGNENIIDIQLLEEEFVSNTDEQWVMINQYGNLNRLHLTKEANSSPIEITQTSPPGVEGMKVNISTSAFYFPMK